MVPLVVVGLLSAHAQSPGNEPDKTDPAKIDAAKIDALVRQLGADEFAAREAAHAALAQLGELAFDALDAAQNHDDVEIALRARALVDQIRIHWSTERDPPEARHILRGYGEVNSSERLNRIERLAKLDGWQGFGSLCRVARFETDNVLSKRGVLVVLEQPLPSEASRRLELAKRARAAAGSSKRDGARWLVALAATLEDPSAGVKHWAELTRAEQAAAKEAPEAGDDLRLWRRKMLLDLYRWQTRLLLELSRQGEAEAMARQTFGLLKEERDEVRESLDWLVERKLHAVVDDLIRKFSGLIEQDVMLLYRVAEARLRAGDKAAAEAAAQKALGLAPENASDHVDSAYALQERGLFDWAEREYRQVLDREAAGSFHNLRARFLLSEMLHDQARDLAAAETLKGAVDAMDRDPAVAELVERFRDPGSVRSRMHFFYAAHHLAEKREPEHFDHLRQGVEADPTDADLLIAMHRAPGADEAWRKKTLSHIEAAAGQFLDQIRENRQAAEQEVNQALRQYYERQLAINCNQYAWLVGNTVGDYDEAVRASEESLRLQPDTGGYLDTLARCYFAKGDYVKAVKHQRRAVEKEPYSGQIRRQLEFFERVLREKQGQLPE